MMNPLTLTRFGTRLAATVLLGAAFAPATARAASITVFWDRAAIANLNAPAGYGVSEVTAQNAQAAGIPILSVTSIIGKPAAITIGQLLDESSLNPPYPVGAGPATFTSDWTATNTGYSDGSTTLNRYLVFERPITNTIDVNGQPQNVTYDPADVGLTLSNDGGGSGVDWVILSLPVAGNNTLYYPAVSLGTFLVGSPAADFPLLYTLHNPQVFTENFNYKLGIPKWSLDFASIPAAIPEPSSGVLMIMGLLAIAGGRRKHS